VPAPAVAAKAPKSSRAASPTTPVQVVSPPDTDAPKLLAKARSGKGDDLKLIWGVGPKLARLLNTLGVWHFDQIAAWTPKELAWIDSKMEGFKGRAVCDAWVDQSKKLASGWRPDSAVGDKPEGK
jgi:NADH-quinone oxidoreductase subunit E